MDDGDERLPPAAFQERDERFVDHQLDVIAAPCPPPQPETERQVHGAPSVAVGHPLHEQPARPGKRLELIPRARKISLAEFLERAVHEKGIAGFALRARGAPDVHLFARRGERVCKLPHVVGNPARSGRILRRDDMDHAHSVLSTPSSYAARLTTKNVATGASGTRRRGREKPTCSRTSGHALNR